MRQSRCYSFAGEWCRLLCEAPNAPYLLERFEWVAKHGFTASGDDIDSEDIDRLVIWLKVCGCDAETMINDELGMETQRFDPPPTQLLDVCDEAKVLFEDEWANGWTRIFISLDGVHPWN
jgi:hypothetical protein